MKTSQVLLQHDSARPHTSLCTREAVATIVWTVLPHPSYSPDFAPSDVHLFGPLKDALWRRYFVNDGELKHNVCLKSSDASAKSSSFSWPACSVICKGGESVLIMRETLWKSNLNFIKDVPMICVYFIIIVFAEKKISRQYFCTATL